MSLTFYDFRLQRYEFSVNSVFRGIYFNIIYICRLTFGKVCSESRNIRLKRIIQHELFGGVPKIEYFCSEFKRIMPCKHLKLKKRGKLEKELSKVFAKQSQDK